MKKYNLKLLTLFTFLGLSITTLTGCGSVGAKAEGDTHVEITENNNEVVVPEREIGHKVPNGKYNPSAVLVKTKTLTESKLDGINYKNYEQLYKGSDWYKVTLETKDEEVTQRIVRELEDSNKFDDVDFDYLMGADALDLPVEVSTNPYAADQKTYLETTGVLDGWKHQKEKGIEPGGSKDVVVAVIDTGVDYNHPDLINNIWCNPGEIPNDGVDNDNNGYVDDYHGYDFVGNDKDPIDDNGHGTHVAGIIAAENNDKGVVGIAYNTKIMCVKAGNSSGYFNSSDIAKAITYAYMNGASVINMSFGGYDISKLMREALENAYLTSLLVAAAGNDSLCNYIPHNSNHPSAPMFPAALPYVIGVMSCDQQGSKQSLFSNYDHVSNDYYEYEIYAPGESILSTWPNNKYAKLNGTSMAAPVVSGIAALLRADLKDRDVYSNKYIQAQITRTSDNLISLHSCVNYLKALTTNPSPDIWVNQSFVYDSKSLDSNNNNDGIIDAGETINLGVELINRGGASSNTIATIDVNRGGVTGTDPYISIIKNTLNYDEIGTYVAKDGTKIFDDNKNVIGMKKCFVLKISPDCPNNYIFKLNFKIESNNKLDATDKTIYKNNRSINLKVCAGMKIPNSITENLILKNDKTYVIDSPVTIANNATLTFEEGCQIEVVYPLDYPTNNNFYINVFGTLNFKGTSEKPINLTCPSSNQLLIKGKGNFNATCTSFYNVTNDKSYCKNNVDKCEFYYKNIGQSGYMSPKGVSNSFIQFEGDYIVVDVEGVKDSVIKVISKPDATGPHHNIALRNTHNVIVDFLYYEINEFSDYSYLSLYDSSEVIFNDLNPYDNKVPLIPLHIETGNSNIALKGKYDSQKLKYVENYYDQNGSPRPEIVSEETISSRIPAYVKNFELLDKDGNIVDKASNENTKFKVTFNKPMDTSKNPRVTFGSIEPFADYLIKGDWINNTTWQGEYSVKAEIENGNQYLNVKGAYSADNDFIPCISIFKNVTFNIDTLGAMSMNINALANSDGTVTLKWVQDDYDTLMGYNIYRSEEKDGNYIRINPSIIPENENTFIDTDAEPGKNYWYTFTVVLTDFSESRPAGKTSCTTLDTMVPRVYHTPVNQGYLGTNLIISCLASDNVGIESATVYYRTKGDNSYNSCQMAKNNDKYSALIFGNELNIKGLEYYIEIKDGNNTVYKGSKENPYQVIIKEASSISQIGDVDGDSKITSKDALMIMQALEGKIILTDDQFKRADLNKDGVLSAAEALRILQYINGNVSSLEMN